MHYAHLCARRTLPSQLPTPPPSEHARAHAPPPSTPASLDEAQRGRARDRPLFATVDWTPRS
eukprot:1844213-Lingulodinium_polyedra.AAC.1